MKQKLAIPMKLNFFAEEPPAPPTGDPAATSASEPAATPPAPPPDDPAKAADASALPDFEKMLSEKFAEWENKQTEAQKLAKMTADEKAEYEKKKQEEDYNTRLAELTKKELRIEAHKTLTEKDLPIELLDALVYSDANSCNASITAVEKAFRIALEKGVNDRLRGKAPGASNGSSATLTIDQIKNMSQAEVMANMGEIEKVLANN